MGECEAGWDRKERALFKEYLKLWKSVTGGLATFTSLVPVAGLKFEDVAPPWPQWSPVVPPILAAVVIVFLFFSREWWRESRVRAMSSRLLTFGIVLLFGYVATLAALVETVEGERHVIGLWLTTEAQQAVEGGKVADTARDLLGYFGHSSDERIWRYRAVAHTLLFALFCVPPVLVSSGLALLMVKSFMTLR